MESHANQQQMPVNTENEVVVAAHVRRRKPPALDANGKRIKPYPTKWGRGKTYGFDDARVVLVWRDVPLLKRIATAITVLRGGVSRIEQPLCVIAPKGVRPVVKPASLVVDPADKYGHNEFLLGEK